MADGNVNKGRYKVKLPFEGLSKQANAGVMFEQFNDSLMSVGQVNDDGNISIFTSDGVTVHKEEDVLITCKGKPILVGVRDEYGDIEYHWYSNVTTGNPASQQRKQQKHCKKQTVFMIFRRQRSTSNGCMLRVASP